MLISLRWCLFKCLFEGLFKYCVMHEICVVKISRQNFPTLRLHLNHTPESVLYNYISIDDVVQVSIYLQIHHASTYKDLLHCIWINQQTKKPELTESHSHVPSLLWNLGSSNIQTDMCCVYCIGTISCHIHKTDIKANQKVVDFTYFNVFCFMTDKIFGWTYSCNFCV